MAQTARLPAGRAGGGLAGGPWAVAALGGVPGPASLGVAAGDAWPGSRDCDRAIHQPVAEDRPEAGPGRLGGRADRNRRVLLRRSQLRESARVPAHPFTV